MRRPLFKIALALLSTSFLLTSCSETLSNIFSDIVDGVKTIADKVAKISEPIIDNITAGAQYVYENVAHFTEEAVRNIQEKSVEIAGNVEESIIGTNPNNLSNYETKYSEGTFYLSKDCNQFADPQGFNHVEHFSFEFEEFIPYYVSTILASYGYAVFAGLAFNKGECYTGLIFTKNDTFIEYQGEDTPTCGFVQLFLDGSNDPIIDEDVVLSGLIAVPNKEYADDNNYCEAFVVTDSADIDEQAGVSCGYYFEFKQLNRYCLSVNVKDELPKNYSSYPYEIYDFDHRKVIKSKSKNTTRDELLRISNMDSNAFEKGMVTNNAIAEIEACSSSNDSINAVMTFTSDDLDVSKTTLRKNAYEFVDSYDGSLDDKQVNSFSKETTFDENKASETIISLVSNSLALVGTTATVVVGTVAGTPCIKAIVLTTGISAIVYNVSNIIENVQTIYYGLNNLEEEAVNPVYQAFASVIKDDNTAKIVYHAWGIANTVIASLTRPVSKALEISFAKGLGRFQTAISVLRAVLVTIAKASVAAIGGALFGNFINRIVTYVTDNRFIGNMVGFASTMLVSMLIFKGLDKIDQKLNISGLYPKAQVATSFKADYERNNKKYSWESRNPDFEDLSRSEKEMYAREIRDLACNDLKLYDKPKINFVYDYSEPSSGYYSNYDNTLTVNMASSENRTWSGIADTIGHECRHAYQYTYATPGSAMEYSLNHYITPEQGYGAYRYQLCEADAWDYGSTFADMILSLLF